MPGIVLSIAVTSVFTEIGWKVSDCPARTAAPVADPGGMVGGASKFMLGGTVFTSEEADACDPSSSEGEVEREPRACCWGVGRFTITVGKVARV